MPYSSQHVDLIPLYLLAFVLTVAGEFFLLYCKNSRSNFFKKNFGITSGKSTTNAMLLGGGPLSVVILGSIFYLAFLRFNDYVENTIFISWLVSGSIISFYGYLDDRFELRPMVKLGFQFFSVFLFSILSSHYFHPNFSSYVFILLMFYGLGVVNGANLLDGLDTLTFKVQGVTFLLFAYLGFKYDSIPVQVSAIVCFVSLFGFYLFNRHPAKIYLGEIGGSFIGLSHLAISSLLYHTVRTHNYSIPQSLAISLLPLSVPMVELGISFLRRIYNKRSPFKGDRLHIHYIIRNYLEIKDNHVGTYLSLSHILILVSLFTAESYYHWHPFITYCSFVFCLMGLQIYFGKNYWKGKDTISFRPREFLGILRKKKILIIETQKIEEFQIQLLEDDQAFDDDDDLAA